MMDFYLNQKPVLEINPRHPLIKKLKEEVEAGHTEVRTNWAAAVWSFVFVSCMCCRF